MTYNVNNVTADQVAEMQANTVSSTNNTTTAQGNNDGSIGLKFLTPSNIALYQTLSTEIMSSDSAPPAGLNMSPADDFGVSSDPAVAQRQLFDLMEWTSQSGYGKADCAAVWIAAMIGFNIRLHQWTTPGNPNYIDPSDPAYASVTSIQETLNALTGAQLTSGPNAGETLSDAIAKEIGADALYYTYKKNGGNLQQANQTLLNALNTVNSLYAQMNHTNPMLGAIVDSLNGLSTDPSWEDQYVVNGQLINADWTNQELATWLSTGMYDWCSDPSNNLRAIEGQCRGDWFMDMVDSGQSTLYCILLLLTVLMDQYYIDAGGISAQLDLYSNVTDSYSTMMADSSTTNMTDDQAAELQSSAEEVQWQTTYNPRLAGNTDAADTAATNILDILDTGSGTPAENWNNYFNPVETDPNSPNYAGNGGSGVDTSQQSLLVQQLNTAENAGSTQLTSYSSNLTTEMQQDMQMIQQLTKTGQDIEQKTSDQINYSIQKVTAG